MKPQQSVQLAKLSRPRLFDALPRERLFTHLDELSRCPVLWVAAPPGAGKTTLVAGWLESRNRVGIWYQVDAGDADPASLFYYLGRAEQVRAGRSKKQRPLPLFTPEHTPDLAGFSRRFFRELFARLGPGATLVFDNFQEAGDEPAFHQAIVAALENVPAGVNVLVVSRLEPPQPYAQFSANRTLALIDWETLKLDREESRSIAGAHLDLEDAVLERLHERAGGWAAGLILLAERLRRGADVEDIEAPDSLQDVFAYFAGQLFERSDAETQRMLLHLSYPPAVPASMAEALTGNASAPRLLDQLYRRHLFTDRRKAAEPVYQFHALFRAFLQHRATHELSLTQQHSIARQAAQLLEGAGEIEHAMALRFSARDWPAAQALVLTHAPRLIAQGRWRIVVDWIERLPAEILSENCWLLHWLGTAWIAVDPPKARIYLERCYLKSLELDDRICEVQSAAGFVETYMMEYADFAPIDRWIEVLEQIAEPDYRFPTLESELRALSAMVIALTYRRAAHPELARFASRCLELLHTGVDVNQRAFTGAFLELYGGMCGRLDVALATHRIVQPLLDHPDVTSLTKAFAMGIGIWTCVHVEDFEEGRRLTERIEVLGCDENLHLAHRFACVIACYLDFRRGDLGSAQARIRRFEQILIPSAPYEAASILGMKSYFGLFAGQPDLTLAVGDELVRRYDRTGSLPHRLIMYNVVIWGNVVTGRFEEAERLIDASRQIQPSQHMEWQGWGRDVFEAWIAYRRGDRKRLHEWLDNLFASSRPRSMGYGFATMWTKDFMTQLCAEALAADIQVPNVCDYIREYRVDAPGQHIENWPWPLRIYTLGPFRVARDGEPLMFGGKVPKKLLALLKSMIAFGGRDVPEERITDALWPDEDGDAAHQSFTTALHRLRRLLGSAELIAQKAGRLSLNTRLIWVDAFAFEETCRQAHEKHRDAASNDYLAVANRAFDLYRGGFLEGDVDAFWAMATKERLREHLLHLLSELGSRLEHERRYDEALTLYRRGIEADELAETFHQGLMRCHHHVGRRPEALDAYRRMCELLEKVHGVKPSPETEALYRKLLSRENQRHE